MKKIIITLFFTTCYLFALQISHSKIINDFNIKNTSKNKTTLNKISSTITRSDKNRFKTIIKSQSKNAFLLKNKLEELNAPEFMLYIAMIESKLNSNIKNKSVSGVWQFQKYTAKKFGLRVDMQKDERNDVEKSTKAAYKYMKYLKNSFGSWYLALMAYNCGEGRLNQAILKTGSRNFNDLMLSDALPNTTKEFTKNVMRYAYVANANEYKTMLSYLDRKVKSEDLKKIRLKNTLNLAHVSKKLNISLSKLKRINNTNSMEARNYLYIPKDKFNLYLVHFEKKNPKIAKK